MYYSPDFEVHARSHGHGFLYSNSMDHYTVLDQCKHLTTNYIDKGCLELCFFNIKTPKKVKKHNSGAI